MLYPKWLFSLGLLSFSLLMGCSSTDTIDTSTAEGAYKLAQSYEKDERYEEAIIYFREVKNKHPYSRFATDSELAVADIQFKREAFAEAEISYRLFKELHPSHPKMDYVTYRLGMSIFNQKPGTIDRDLTLLNKAIIYLDEVITSFSQSTFAKEAKKRKLEAQKMLAEKEIYIADWYFGQKEWLSSLGRYEDLLGKHGRLGFDKRALYGAAVAAYRTNEQGKARSYLQKLKERFGDSSEYADAKKELGR